MRRSSPFFALSRFIRVWIANGGSWRQSSMMEIAVCKSHVADGICRDNCGECNFWVMLLPARGSELQLHQVGVVQGMEEATRRHGVGCG
jgi:hypothetical protein